MNDRRLENLEPYASNWEHLADELLRLDLLLQLRLQVGATGGDDPLRRLKGLVVTEDEVASLLATGSNDAAANGAGAGDAALLAALDDAMATIGRRLALTNDAGERRLELPALVEQFRLNAVECLCLVMGLAAELDGKYEKLFAYAQDDVTRKRPTIGLALRLACRSREEEVAARVLFDVHAPLRLFRLMHVIEGSADGPLPAASRPLRLDDRITDQLLGGRSIDARLSGAVRLIDAAREPTPLVPGSVVEQLTAFLSRTFAGDAGDFLPILFHLVDAGRDADRAVAMLAARQLGLPLLACDARLLPTERAPIDELLWLLAREAALQPAVLAIEHFDALVAEHGADERAACALVDAASMLSRLTFLCGRQPWRLPSMYRDRFTFIPWTPPRPGYGERVAAWREQLRDVDGAAIDPHDLASRFRLAPAEIVACIADARDERRWRGGDGAALQTADVDRACRRSSSPALHALARKISPSRVWSDLVLPEDQLVQLCELCDQARQRSVVLGQWGFDGKLSLGKGVAALFSGPPGTGKTMAAEVVAAELSLDLFKIDLSRIVSKYIGESEKNLDRVFTAAEDADAILFFDEADALFGKRSEVRDSHDRYANLEVSYLLQKMEEYEGVSILATNLRSHLDEAFLRRLQVIVEFPFPDAAQRERIWRVTFPRAAPLGDDVDLPRLAQEVRLSGGNIKNISLAAAYLAASNGGVIEMAHLHHAARREHEKLGRTFDAGRLATGGAR